MQEQLISFETAKLANIKGFFLPKDKFYCEKYGNCLCEISGEDGVNLTIYDPIKWKTIYDCNGEFEIGDRFYAVTQSLLQKWLREKHGFLISIELFGISSTNGWCYSFRKYEAGKLIYNTNQKASSVHLKYEEALEEGLQEALKQIK